MNVGAMMVGERGDNIADLPERLTALAAEANGWFFPSKIVRDCSSSVYQYPAVMVPEMQRALLGELVTATGAACLYDPFVGSGTSVAEGMRLGLDVVCADINPLAVLVTRARTGPLLIDAFASGIRRVEDTAARDRRRSLAVDMPNRRKWFRDDVSLYLSRLRRAISLEQNPAVRRFLWVALAETARLSSNARTSSIKLYARDGHEAKSRAIDPLKIFSRTCERGLVRASEFRDELAAAGHMHRGHYKGEVSIAVSDIAAEPLARFARRRPDILVSSPPYGDNATTVAYGQQSYLPLQWVDLCDISRDVDRDLVSGIYEIDGRSLGGRGGQVRGVAREVVSASAALAEYLEELSAEPRERRTKTMAFYSDLYRGLRGVVSTMAPESLMAWTIGNRRVGGRPVPFDSILRELLAAMGVEAIAEIRREIPVYRKRMGFAESLAAEKVCVFRTRTPLEFTA